MRSKLTMPWLSGKSRVEDHRVDSSTGKPLQTPPTTHPLHAAGYRHPSSGGAPEGRPDAAAQPLRQVGSWVDVQIRSSLTASRPHRDAPMGPAFDPTSWPLWCCPSGEKLDHDPYAKHRRTLTHLPHFILECGGRSTCAAESHPEKSGGRASDATGSAGARSRGIVSRALAPFPSGEFSSSSVPPWPSAICRQRARPIPLPPGLVV